MSILGSKDVILFLAATMLAASPEAVQTSPAGEPIEVNGKKQKPKQHCQFIEVSGSRMRQRVCTDSNGVTQGVPGVTSDAGSNPGMIHAIPGAAEGGLGGVPK